MTTLKRIWFLLFFSTLVFAIVLNDTILSRPNEPVIWLHLKVMGIALAILSILLFGFAFFIRNFLVKAYLKTSPITEASKSEEHIDKIYLASVLQWTLFEGITIYGFIVANIGNSFLYGLPFWALSSLGFALTYPTEARLISSVQKLHRANMKSH